jgi:hypothetical protein
MTGSDLSVHLHEGIADGAASGPAPNPSSLPSHSQSHSHPKPVSAFGSAKDVLASLPVPVVPVLGQQESCIALAAPLPQAATAAANAPAVAANASKVAVAVGAAHTPGIAMRHKSMRRGEGVDPARNGMRYYDHTACSIHWHVYQPAADRRAGAAAAGRF